MISWKRFCFKLDIYVQKIKYHTCLVISTLTKQALNILVPASTPIQKEIIIDIEK
jgi:hypothetical protein